jgi:tetratricopeptide (TPR) repeat protein
MRYLCSGWWLLVCAALSNGAEPTLKDARQRWLHGNYEEARSLYQNLANEPESKVQAALGISRTWLSQGEPGRALDVLEAAIPRNPANADLHAARAQILYLRGRWDEAERAADAALSTKPGNLLARWVRAQVYRDRADTKKADQEFRWFVRTYTERSDKDNDIKDPDELLMVALAGAENARWHHLSDQFRVILTDVLGEALNQEKNFWPAEYLAGMLLLEKYNRGEALDAFDKALAINPNAAEALVGKGMAAMQTYEIKDAEQFATRALKINPNLPEAHRLLADVHTFAGDIKAAQSELEIARKINPRDERTLGRCAACRLLAHDDRGFEALCQEVLKQDPKPSILYFELAERLDERKRFEAAEKYYKKSIEQRPELPWPQSGLGLLYMRLGREKEAREVLDKAFKADEFNVRVANMLKVLRHLDKYQALRTEHFEVRFDPQTDQRLAAYMAPYLEGIYGELAAKFRYQPPQRILVEVFNNHEMFSGRTIALPDLHTVGASTGRMIAMVSPHGTGIRRPFNWVRVLRHELVHIFNLEQSGFQVPHWFTEGLAVIQEGFPRPPQWNQLLRQRAAADDLLNLDTIELGFIRPRSQLDWHLAYCQSQLYVEYMTEKYGAESVGKMLAGYRDGLDTDAAIVKACRIDKESFEKGYRVYIDGILEGMFSHDHLSPRIPEKAMTYGQLQKAHEADPGNRVLAARLAEQHLIRRDKKESRRLAEEVLAKESGHPLAAYVKARLLLDAGDEEQARTLLESAVNRLTPDLKVLQALGKLYFENRDFTKAAEIYELAHKVDPYESKWLTDLLRVYTQAGEKPKQIDILKKLVPLDPDDLDQRKRLAQMLLEAGRHGEAERYARQALEIDVRDVEAREMLEKALVAQNKSADADRLRTLLAK